jgi:O-succinylbenzoic acid--CoA ligase
MPVPWRRPAVVRSGLFVDGEGCFAVSAECEFEHWSTPWLARRALLSPSRIALCTPGEQLSFAQLHQRTVVLAGQLRAAGVGEGDLVACYLPNTQLFVILLHALQRRGAVLLPLNTRLAPLERAAQLRQWGVRFLVCHAGEHGLTGVDPLPVPCLNIGVEGISLDAGGVSVSMPPAAQLAPELRSALAVVPTSGSRGRAKGVVLGPENFLASALAVQRLLGASQVDRWLLCMPLFHVAGLSIVTRSCLVGSSIVLHSGFDAAAVNRALQEEGVTHVSLVPTMLRRLLDYRGNAPCPVNVRCVLLGGAPADDALLREARALGYPLALTYGLTEATSQVATSLPGEAADPGGCRLRPLPGMQLRIVPAGDKAGSGEIQLRGSTVMRGYLGDDGVCAGLVAGGWLATGDLGRLDGEGRLLVLGRRDDMIISGGENLYPTEVEAVLVQHPAVAEACVVGRADAQFGQRPVAYWVATQDQVATPDQVPSSTAFAAFCRARLASYKVPVAFHRLAALPRNATGKVIRDRLPHG